MVWSRSSMRAPWPEKPGAVMNPPAWNASSRVSTRGPKANPRVSRSGSDISTARATNGLSPAVKVWPRLSFRRLSRSVSTAAPGTPPSGRNASSIDTGRPAASVSSTVPARG